MRGIENHVIGRKCSKCGEIILYGEVYYPHGLEELCRKCSLNADKRERRKKNSENICS